MSELLWPLSMRTQLWETRDAVSQTLLNDSSLFVVDSWIILCLAVLGIMLVLIQVRKSRENCASTFFPDQSPNDLFLEKS